jgi:hypothetical protein
LTAETSLTQILGWRTDWTTLYGGTVDDAVYNSYGEEIGTYEQEVRTAEGEVTHWETEHRDLTRQFELDEEERDAASLRLENQQADIEW